MKKLVLSNALTFALALLLFGGSGVPIAPLTASAQNAAAKSDFITDVRQWARDSIIIDDRGQALKARYDALDLGNVLVDGDFVGANEGITKTQLVAGMTSLSALHTTFASGHNTNLHRLK